VDLEAVDAETLADRILDLLDVDAIDGAGPGTLIATNASGQVETMEAAVARLHRHGQLGILELLGEGPALVSLEEIPKRYVHPLANRLDGEVEIAKPRTHEILALAESNEAHL